MDILLQLDIETPTTADVPSGEPFTAESAGSHGVGCVDIELNNNKDFLTSDGFNFSTLLEDDDAAAGDASDIQTLDSNGSSPSKHIANINKDCNEFDPFGLKCIQKFSTDRFDNESKHDKNAFSYTNPCEIMREAQKKPYANIFVSHLEDKEEDETKVTCDNIATLTACLQRSVMLPLTYQLEVVNNSILTHYLVNLDMYEHLRSLKDYFFLMDGEFSKSICHNLFSKLVKTVNPQELLNFATLHNILDKALGSSISRKFNFV